MDDYYYYNEFKLINYTNQGGDKNGKEIIWNIRRKRIC